MAEVKPGAKFRDVGDIISQHAQQQGCVSAQRLQLLPSLHVPVCYGDVVQCCNVVVGVSGSPFAVNPAVHFGLRRLMLCCITFAS